MMIDHLSIGVRDIAKAKAFYDAALKPIGYACLSSSEGSLGYGPSRILDQRYPKSRPTRTALRTTFLLHGSDAQKRRCLSSGRDPSWRQRQRQAGTARGLRHELLCGLRCRS
jgi:catechol 2,3-dioxygenase-like lactoylglutathione lyase family enzyme